MASPPALHLFPVESSVPARRKPSIKQPRSNPIDQNAANRLQGVAVQVSSSRSTSADRIAQPAANKMQSTHNNTMPQPNIAARRKQSKEALAKQSSNVNNESKSLVESRPALETRVDSFVRPTMSNNPHEIRAGPVSPLDADELAPLPGLTNSKTSRVSSSQYSTVTSQRSSSLTLLRSNSGVSTQQATSPPPMRSIFPEYDHSRTLREQQYYPTGARSPPPRVTSEKMTKSGASETRPTTVKASASTSSSTFVDRYEHIRRAGDNDLLDLWKASCCHFPVTARKLLLGLHQPRQSGTCLSIGTTPDEALYSMTKDNATDDLIIKKHYPLQPSFTPVAQLVLPDPEMPNKAKQEAAVSIFPQMAGVHAQGGGIAGRKSREGESSSQGSRSTTPEEARAAHKTYADAYAKYCCQLVRTTRKRESLGVVTATYTLKHPAHGTFPITVTKSQRPDSNDGSSSKKNQSQIPAEARAKISLHHFSASPGAINAETMVLAFLDFSRDACVLDTPALVALDGPYVIDTVVSALLAVAVIENDALMAEAVVFDPPPQKPTHVHSLSTSSSSAAADAAAAKRKSTFRPPPTVPITEAPKSRKWFSKKQKKVKPADEVDLPLVTQGALAVLGISLRTAVWVLETGVKVTAGVVVGVSHMATKA